MMRSRSFFCNLSLAVIALAALAFCSCETTSSLPSDNGREVAVEIEPPQSAYFSDWEYRGFGRMLPDWVEPAFFGGADAVRKECKKFADRQVFLVSAYGINPDQAVRKLFTKIEQSEIPDSLNPYETLWVRVSPEVPAESEYLALVIYTE